MAHLPPCLAQAVENGLAAVVGGAVRAEFDGTRVNDIDVFVFSSRLHRRLVGELDCVEKPDTNGAVYVHSVDASSVPVEIVYQPGWTSAAQCSAKADFNISSGVYSAGKYTWHPSFPYAAKNKRMRLLRTDFAARTYERCLKFKQEYGYEGDETVAAFLAEREADEQLLRAWKSAPITPPLRTRLRELFRRLSIIVVAKARLPANATEERN
jgi:hypothetical protein